MVERLEENSRAACKELVKTHIWDLSKQIFGCDTSHISPRASSSCNQDDQLVLECGGVVEDISGDMNHVYRVTIITHRPPGAPKDVYTAGADMESADATANDDRDEDEENGLSVVVKMAPDDVLVCRLFSRSLSYQRKKVPQN